MRVALLSVSRYATDAMLEDIAEAGNIRGADIAALWSPAVPSVVACEVRCVSRVSELTDDDCPVVFPETIDIPADLAYHTQTDGHPWGLVLADQYQSRDSITNAGLHEIGEMQVDPQADKYVTVTLPDGTTVSIAREIYDAVQGLSAPVRLKVGRLVAASPFNTPAWFQLGTVLDGTPTVSNGYALAAGDVAPESYYQREDGSERMAMDYRHAPSKLHPHSRRSKRARKLGRRIGLLR